MISVIAEKYLFSSATTRSRSSCSEMDVNPRMSANSTVIVWSIPPRRNDDGSSSSCLTTYSGMKRP